MKKMICLLFVTLLFAASSFSVFAAEVNQSQGEPSSVQPRYAIINTLTAGLSIDSSGKATCSARLVSGSSGSDCTIIMELQQKSSKTWSTVKTWTVSKSNASSVSAEKGYYVTHGTYRVKVTGTVENTTKNVDETAVKYSKEVAY